VTRSLRLRRPALSLLCVAWLLAAAAGCGRDPLDGEPACGELRLERPPGRIPVVLVLNDAMRRDRAGVYGGQAQTPTFDRFARENLLFAAAFTQAPWTLPSVATLFTSLYPSQHGVDLEPGSKREARALSDSLTTMAEVFRAAGYRTAAFVSNPWMGRRFGFAQGYDTYADSSSWSRDGVRLSEEALAWLRQQPPDAPFFLYLHYVDSHRPYPALTLEELRANADRIRADRRPVSDALRQELDQLISIEDGGLTGSLVERRIALVELAYEKGISSFDRAFATFLAGFEQIPAARDAAIIVTSDHGEALYERGYGNHGQGLHDDELAIPLAARLPGVSASTHPISCQVGLIDVLPTLCDYLSLECPKVMFGRSWLRSGSGPRWLVSEGVGAQPRHRAIRNRAWKLMWEPDQPPDGVRSNPYRLYHVAVDPGEREDLADSTLPEARRALERLEPVLHGAVPAFAGASASVAPIDPALEERLRGLGYLEDKKK